MGVDKQQQINLSHIFVKSSWKLQLLQNMVSSLSVDCLKKFEIVNGFYGLNLCVEITTKL